jgi:hypothetical protein
VTPEAFTIPNVPYSYNAIVAAIGGAKSVGTLISSGMRSPWLLDFSQNLAALLETRRRIAHGLKMFSDLV